VKFEPTPLEGVWLLELEPLTDERGYFARTFDRQLFAANGLDSEIVQANTSFNLRKGTLRGMHYQEEPHAEGKLIRCTRGAIFDVLVDVRHRSPTRAQWVGFELTEDNGCALFAAAGLAHGFQTLLDSTEVAYEMFAPYVAGSGVGVRWDDPMFAIEWPEAPQSGRVISDRDRGWPDWTQ